MVRYEVTSMSCEVLVNNKGKVAFSGTLTFGGDMNFMGTLTVTKLLWTLSVTKLNFILALSATKLLFICN